MYYGSKLSVISDYLEILPVSGSPLKQIPSGVNPNFVICKEDFELVFKAVDNSPVCVKPTTAEKLIQKGWTNNFCGG